MRDYVVRHKNVPLNCGYIRLEYTPVTKGSYPWSIRVINDMNKGALCGSDEPKRFKNIHCSEDAVKKFCEMYKDKKSMYVDYEELFADVYEIKKLVLFDYKANEWGLVNPYPEVYQFLNNYYRPYNNEVVTFDKILELAEQKFKKGCNDLMSGYYWQISHQLWSIINEWNIVGFIYKEKEIL